MGLYTELVLACELKPETSQIAIETIKIWTGEAQYSETTPVPWYYATLDSDSSSFPGLVHHAIECESFGSENDTCYFTLRMSRKNYDYDLETFLVWLAPYSATEGFVGHMRMDVDKNNPKLIFFRNGKAIFKECISFTETEISTSRSI
jgi:hypothetical protein